jgi:hypothetical protein
VDQPGHKHNFEVFGIELDLHLRKTLPSGTLSGYLEGLDGDIRQDAAKELLVHFLEGNRDLQAAVEVRDILAISTALGKAIAVCLSNNRKRRLQREMRHKGVEDPCAHAEQFQLPWDGEPKTDAHESEHKMRARMANLLSSRTASQELDPKDIELLRSLFIDELTRKQVALTLGKSESWISKRLTRLQKRLTVSKSVREFLEMDM